MCPNSNGTEIMGTNVGLIAHHILVLGLYNVLFTLETIEIMTEIWQ